VKGWLRRHAEVVSGMQQVMGPFPGPEMRCPLDVRTHEEIERRSHLLRRISYVLPQLPLSVRLDQLRSTQARRSDYRCPRLDRQFSGRAGVPCGHTLGCRKSGEAIWAA